MAKEAEDSISGKYKLENFILKIIGNRKEELEQLKIDKENYTLLDYTILFNRFSASINDLYIVLTAYDDKYKSFISDSESGNGIMNAIRKKHK